MSGPAAWRSRPGGHGAVRATDLMAAALAAIALPLAITHAGQVALTRLDPMAGSDRLLAESAYAPGWFLLAVIGAKFGLLCIMVLLAVPGGAFLLRHGRAGWGSALACGALAGAAIGGGEAAVTLAILPLCMGMGLAWWLTLRLLRPAAFRAGAENVLPR